MTKEKSNELATTVGWLMSIIDSASNYHWAKIEAYERNREEYLRKLGKYKRTDRAEYERLMHTVQECENSEIMSMLLYEFWEALWTNPFPGKCMRAYAIACELFPNAEIPKQGTNAGTWKGADAWRRVFLDSHIPLNIHIRFPVQIGIWDIDDLEEKLHALACEDGYIHAHILSDLLCLGVNTKQYRSIKEELSCRGWTWKSCRNNGKKLKIITPPNP